MYHQNNTIILSAEFHCAVIEFIRFTAHSVEYFAHPTTGLRRNSAVKKSGKDFLLLSASTHLKSKIMNNTSKILIGFVAGAAIGGALGILLAPDKGSETRRRIVERGNEMGESLSSFGESMKDKFNDVVDGVKGSFNRSKSSMS